MAKKRNRRERRERRGSSQPRSAPTVSTTTLDELEGRWDNPTGGMAFPINRIEGHEPISDTDIYEGALETGSDIGQPNDMESLDLLREREQLAGSTDDAYKASQEGLTYVPPTDEPYDEDRPRTFAGSDDEAAERLRAALRADSRTADYAESVEIMASASHVVLRGVVDDQAAAESLLSVIGDAAGVAEVLNRLDVRALRHGR